jgi:hypothetical protein
MLKDGKFTLDESNSKTEINTININGSVSGSNIVGNMDNSSASVNNRSS